MVWRWASASVIGTSHVVNGGGLQDAHVVRQLSNGGILAIVSDGAGSAMYGAYGAWLACRYLTIRFREYSRKQPGLPTDETLVSWIDQLRDWISAAATTKETEPRQFAATLAAVIVFPDGGLTLQVGDSAIVGRNGEDWEVLCWPENGEYASSTYFITDDPVPRLHIARHNHFYNAFAVFSDGVGDLALSQKDETAFPGFLDPMIRPIANAEDNGRLVDVSQNLATFLHSPKVCDRTDDDKTIVLISRG